MKYVFFLLILVNILFYLWETGVGRQPETHKETSNPPAQESLVLIKETSENQSKSPANGATKSAEIPPQQPPQPSTANQPNPPSLPQKTGEEVPGTAPHQPGETDQHLICHRIGPFASLRKAQIFQKKHIPTSESVEPIKKPTEMENGYVILYPAANTLQEAKDNRNMLQEKGFTDAWLIQEGENRYAISLATTNDKALADVAISRYQTQGIMAELKTRKTLTEKWWLEIKGDFDPAALPPQQSHSDTGRAAPEIEECE